jgi:hypothetical protein
MATSPPWPAIVYAHPIARECSGSCCRGLSSGKLRIDGGIASFRTTVAQIRGIELEAVLTGFFEGVQRNIVLKVRAC